MKSSPPPGAVAGGSGRAAGALRAEPESVLDATAAAPGRPPEIEEATNRLLIHPLSRRLAGALARTSMTPNQVSVASLVAAGLGAGAYLWLDWPWSAAAGLAAFFAWHVLDGADGELARRTGRASTSGELVDGICDHLSQALLYVAFAIILARGVGAVAWGLAALAAASHFVQSNAYETGRKSYRHFMYGASWMRQNAQAIEAMGSARRVLANLYLGVSSLANPGEVAMAAAVASAHGQDTRALYQRLFAPQVKASALLGSNTRTLAAFLSVLVGSPAWYFLFEIVVLNAILVGLLIWRAHLAAAMCDALAAADQAAWAPN